MAGEGGGRLRARLASLPGLSALAADESRARRTPRLDTPVDLHRPLIRSHDPDSFGRASESIARFLGTGRFLVYMTAVVVVWVGWNAFTPAPVHFDDYPFIFLTLVLSLQASYAAPLILLAQNRQDDRDRVNQDADRRAGAQSRADMEFLAREVASLRVAVGEVATRDYVRSEIRSLVDSLSELLEQDDDETRPRPRKSGSKGGGKSDRRAAEAAERRAAEAAARGTTVAELAAGHESGELVSTGREDIDGRDGTGGRR